MLDSSFSKIIILLVVLMNITGCWSKRKTQKSGDIPEFPLPAPSPSAVADLSDYFSKNVSKLDEANEILINALEQNGYSWRSYLWFPNGFALVTQLEKIDEKGYALPESNRWAINNEANSHLDFFNLRFYLYSLFHAKPGYYRCIVFLITSHNYSLSAPSPKWNEKDKWLYRGLRKLPPSIGEKKYTRKHSVTALIYEFKKLEYEDTTNFVTKSLNSGKTHLKNSGILNNIIK